LTQPPCLAGGIGHQPAIPTHSARVGSAGRGRARC
jgi:hypothetical protein